MPKLLEQRKIVKHISIVHMTRESSTAAKQFAIDLESVIERLHCNNLEIKPDTARSAFVFLPAGETRELVIEALAIRGYRNVRCNVDGRSVVKFSR